ncbi:transposase [Actinomycetota bacterium]|nr:transposase [Actinomycetota bacterium]
MSYRHYTDKYRRKVVDDFHNSGLGIVPFCKTVDVSPRALYEWLGNDKRPFKRHKPRIDVLCSFTFEEKMKAIQDVAVYNIDKRQVALRVGVSIAMLYRWIDTYINEGEYNIMGRIDLQNGQISTECSLRKEIEELKKDNFNKQLKLDAYDVSLKILKNYPALSLETSLSDLTNCVKTKAIVKLGADFEYKTNVLIRLFDINERTYYNQLNSVKGGQVWKDRWNDYDKLVHNFILADDNIRGKQGYRQVMMSMEAAGAKVIERRIRIVMQNNNWLAYQTKTMKRYNSYKHDGNPPVTNWLFYKDWDDEKLEFTYKHAFNPDSPWQILGTDVTEFHVNGFKIYLSMIIDFYDSAPVTWKISLHPDTDLIVGSVNDLINITPKGANYVLHMDQGSVNRSQNMKQTCRDNHILQSMSRKGESGDNAPTEGFFGRLKQQWFNKTDFDKCTSDEFIASLDEWLKWFCNVRPLKIYGGLTATAGRSMLHYKKVV